MGAETLTEKLLCEIRDTLQRELGAPGARWSPGVPPLRLRVDTTTGDGYVDVQGSMPNQQAAVRGYLLNTGSDNLLVRVVTPGGTSNPFTLVAGLPEPITYNLVGIKYTPTPKTYLEVKAQ